MVLLLHEDLANLFPHRVFAQRFALPDTLAIIANGFVSLSRSNRSMSSGFLDVRLTRQNASGHPKPVRSAAR
jgi:hypothetical protein